MNLRDLSTGAQDPSPPRKELQGPRPAPLQVRKDSYKIKKPPKPAPPPPKFPAADTNLRLEPVIIYAVSPKIIYADVNDFMNVVQRHTGPSLSSDDLISAGDVSPAARFASIENVSPSDRSRERDRDRAVEVISLVDEGLEISQIPGILSPTPASLSRMWAGFFSPVAEPHNLSTFNDFSPFLQGVNFISSPSANLFSTPIISPTLHFDLFNYDNF